MLFDERLKAYERIAREPLDLMALAAVTKYNVSELKDLMRHYGAECYEDQEEPSLNFFIMVTIEEDW